MTGDFIAPPITLRSGYVSADQGPHRGGTRAGRDGNIAYALPDDRARSVMRQGSRLRYYGRTAGNATQTRDQQRSLLRRIVRACVSSEDDIP
jgi:hypothetical protein